MGSQTILPAMVRAHNESGCIKSYNPHYVKLQTQDVVADGHLGTRTPRSRHIWSSTPCPPTPSRLLCSPPRNYFPKNHERRLPCLTRSQDYMRTSMLRRSVLLLVAARRCGSQVARALLVTLLFARLPRLG